MDLTREFVKKFKAGALLRSDELTNTFNYIRERDDQSRRSLDGAGIAHGLNISYNEGVITLTEGTAVTSDGRLIHCATQSFNVAVKIYDEADAKLNSGPKYADVLNFSDVYELQVIKAKDGKAPKLESDLLQGRCAFLYFTTVPLNQQDCTLRATDQNEVCIEDVKVFIGKQKPVATTAEAAKPCLKSLCLKRFGTYIIDDIIDEKVPKVMTFRDTIDLSSIKNIDEFNTQYKAVVLKNIELIAEAYNTATTCTKDFFCGYSFNNLQDLLSRYINGFFKSDPNIKPESNAPWYVYVSDYLKTLAAAYNEFINTEGVFNRIELIAKDKFPNYILLGNGANCDCRHSWYPAPAHKMPYDEANFYATRMIKLVDFVNLRFADILNGNISDIKITPSYSDAEPLSRRAIPFYFKKEAVINYWNFKLSKGVLTEDMPTYEDSPKNKLLCANREGYDFYRVEGHIGKPLQGVLDRLEALKKDLNIDFDIVPLCINNINWDNDNLHVFQTGINTSAIPIDDLDREFQQHKLDTLCWFWQFDNPKNEALNKIVAYIDEKNFSNFRFKQDIQSIETYFPSFKKADKVFGALSGRYIYCQFDYFKVIERLYWSRLQLTNFCRFAACHTGTDTRGGVTAGGTFIVLYTIEREKDENPGPKAVIVPPTFKQTVVADMMLPCCAVDWRNVPTAVFSLEIIDVPNADGKPTGNVQVKARNLSVNAQKYTWKVETKIPFTQNDKNEYNAVIDFKDLANKSGEVTIILNAEKDGKISIYSETITIIGGVIEVVDNDNVAVDFNTTSTSNIPTTTPVVTAKKTEIEPPAPLPPNPPIVEKSEATPLATPVTETKIEPPLSPNPPIPDKGEATQISTSPTEKVFGRGVTTAQFMMGDEAVTNPAAFNQRQERYKKIIADIETDPSINDNKAFNLTKIFVFFPKPKAALTASFEETTKALLAAINRTQKTEQQRKLMILLQTATHFYMDKIIAAGEPFDNTLNGLSNLNDFMRKKGINTVEFIVDWKSEAIETSEIKAAIGQLKQIFE